MKDRPLQLQRQESARLWSDPIAVMRWAFNKKADPYQVNFLNDESQNVVWVAGRQVGKTTTVASKTLTICLREPEQHVSVISASLSQARIIMDAINYGANHPLIQKLVDKQSQTFIRFINGSTIFNIAAGQTGRTSRGFSPTHLFVDEAAFIPERVMTALRPSLAATGGKLIMTSTPFGKRGQFYEATKTPFFSVHHTPSTECPRITKEFLEHEAMWMTDMEYRQEYLGEFVAEADTYFSIDLVLERTDNELQALNQPRRGYDYYLGVDPARYGTDDSAYVVIEADPQGLLRLAHIEHTIRLPLTDAMGRIQEMHKKWQFRNIFIDETGLGGGVSDFIREVPNLPVRPVTMSAPEKEIMYKGLKKLFEAEADDIDAEGNPIKRNVLTLYPHLKLRNQLVELEYEYKSKGEILFHHPDGGHDDYPDALALACHAFYQPKIAWGVKGSGKT